MATPYQMRNIAAVIVVLLLEAGVTQIPRMVSPLLITLTLRALQITVMALFLKGQFKEGSLGALEPRAIRKAVIQGAAWCLGFGAVAGVGALVLFLCGINPLLLVKMPLPEEPTTLALFFLAGGLVAPVAEELFFRGIIYRLLRPMGMIPAILISTLLFAAAHAMYGVVPLTQLVGGIIFAAAFEKERHLAVPILIHGAGNTALFTLSII